MPGIDKQANYWSVRIRDPDLFASIATPRWMTNHATQLAKQWLVNEEAPELALEKEVNSLDLPGEVMVRHGKLRNPRKGASQWLIQSILVPLTWNLEEEDVADLICFLTQKLDQQADNNYCKKT